jgi:hypothetical protein
MPQLRLLHIAITLSATAVAIALGVLGVLHRPTEFPFPAVFEWVLFGLSATMVLVGAIMRTSFPPVEEVQGIDEWAVTNRGRCVVLWAIIEASVFLAAIALFLGANPLTAGALAAGGLGFLASQSPGTLAGH